MKYIDADILRKEIEFAKSVYSNPKRVVRGVADAFRQDGRAAMCDDILKKLDTIPEQEDILIINKKEWEAQERFRKNKKFGQPLPEQPVEPLTVEDVVEQGKRFGRKVEIINHDEVTLQEPEVPKEICPRCIHYGEYCYQPGGGMQYKINENGVYDCTHFNEKEQPVEGLEEEIDRFCESMWESLPNFDCSDGDAVISVVRNAASHFYELGQQSRPKESEDLEEEVKRCIYDAVYDLDGPAIMATSEYLSVEDVANIARHFAEWGAKNASGKEPKMDLNGKVTFDCIGKQVTMTIQELINYYIDTECCEAAEECGF